MKFYTISVFLMLFTFSHAQVKWMTMNEALKAQEKEPKKIFADVYTDWCGPCKMMDRNTFANEDVAAFINAHFYPVKFNAEGTEIVRYQGEKLTNPNYDPNRKGKRNAQHQFATALKVRGYPTVVFFDENSKIITPLVGYRTPSQIEIYLKMIATDDYKRLKTQEAWNNYQSNFEGTFEK